MREVTRVVLVLGAVVVAGCAGPFAADEPGTTTPSATPAPTPASTPSPTDTPPADDPQLPPGVTSTAIENASQLLDSHVSALNRTGFIGAGAGNGTVFREGILVDVQSNQRNQVAPNASTYRRQRTVNAGPVGQEWEAWGNATVEFRRTKQSGDWTVSRQEPAPVAMLAGRGLLLPYLRGGDYTLDGTNETDDGTRFHLVATAVDDPDALHETLPDATEEVTGFEARVEVDTEGRIHAVRASIQYVIEGREATQHLEYTLEQIGVETVERPDWAAATANETGG